ncbi:hypothetical protein KP509_21G009600 [Ceratopteris richardii]|uniref:Uncharacterized protein n=1 Tax=Ceratopteris richardii TaxID=49495 RepID=A0A8T2SAU4_CERRI|nr:hypothetical protein KP509_21G009600 [Ceratopteris richardii]
MQCVRAMEGFSSPTVLSHRFSSLAPIFTTRLRLTRAGNYSGWRKETRSQGIVLSLIKGPGSRDLRTGEFSKNFYFELLSPSEWNNTLPSSVKLGSRSSTSINAAPSDCWKQGDCCGGIWFQHLGYVIVRASLFAVVSTMFFFSKKVALAAAVADTGIVGIPSLVQQFKSGLSLLGPKFLQVLSVFKDHGLMLSLLLGLSAFFSMAETSITTLWPWKVRELAEKERDGSVFHLLKQDVTRFLTTILIGTTVANIAATALVTDAATALFGEAGVSAATGVMTVVILLLTEITPKSVAVHNATEVARIVVRPVAWLSYVLYPVGRIVTAISMALLKILGLKSSGEPFVTEEELKLMLRGAELSGAIEEEEQDMIENVLEIKDTYVREVMTPLVDVVAIDASATVMDFRNLWVTHQYSRVPVFERRVDNIVGIAYAMDMLDYVEQVEVLQKLTVRRIAHKPAYFVPDSMSVWNLLREFRIRKVHMAIVLNEYGGTVGLVTLEDVVEEIVGEIFDENDSKKRIRRKTGYIVQRADGVFDVDANTSIEDLAEALEVMLPEVPYHYETVSGFVCEAFGYIPRTGESIQVILRNAEEEGPEGDSDTLEDRKEKSSKYHVEILAGNARKVGSVRFEHLTASEDQAAMVLETSTLTPTSRHRWEEQQQGVDYEKVYESERQPWGSDEDPEASSSDDDEHEASPRMRNLIAENIDVDSIRDPVEISPRFPFASDQEHNFNTGPQKSDCHVDSDVIDVSTATAIDTLYTKWEKQRGSRERRRHRRRKSSTESTVELDRDRKFYVRRKEVDGGSRTE